MLYVSFTWYVKVYLEYLLVLPIIKKISNGIHNIWQEGLVFIVLPVAVSFFLPDSEDHFQGIVIWILSSLRILLVLLPSFHVGTIYGKYKLDISRLKIFSELRSSLSSVLIALVGMAFSIIFIRALMGYYQVYWITALVFALSFDYIYKSVNLYPIKKMLGFLGKYSYEYWLISGMFFLNTVEFQWILFIPRISILILIWAFIIVTPAVMLIQYISRKICSCIDKIAVWWNSTEIRINHLNIVNHNLPFRMVKKIFKDASNPIFFDKKHSIDEDRYKIFCILDNSIIAI